MIMADNREQLPTGTVPQRPAPMRAEESDESPQASVIRRVDRGELPPWEEIQSAFPNEADQLAILEQAELRYGDRADRRPIDVPTRTIPLPGVSPREAPSGTRVPTRVVPDMSGAEADARRQGIVTDAPVDSEIRLSGSFITREQARDGYIAARLAQDLGVEQVETRRRNGRMEYLNPETRRWTDASGYGLDPGDFAAATGYSLPIIGEIVGGLIGLPGGIPGVSIGSGAGAGYGQTVRAMVGNAILQNIGLDPVEFGDIAEDAGQEALFATAATVTMGGLARLVNRINHGPRSITPEEIRNIIDSGEFTTSAQVVEDLRKRGYDLRPTTAQMSNLQRYLDMEATLSTGGSGGSFNAAHRLRQQQWGNSATLLAFFDDFSPTAGANLSAREVGRDVVRMAEASRARNVLSPQEYSRRIQRELLDAGNDIPAFNRPLVGRTIRGEADEAGDGVSGLLLARQEARDRADDAWSIVRNLSGTNPQTGRSAVRIPRSDALDRVVNLLAREADRALVGGQAAGKDRLTGRLVTREEDIINILGPDGTPIASFNRNQLDYDFNDVQSAVSYLRRLERSAYRSTDPDLPGIRDIERLKTELLAARNQHLQQTNPDLLVATLEAERATRYAAQTFERGVIGDILRQQDGGFNMSDGEVVRRLFSTGNIEEAQRVAHILSGDAQTMRQVRAHLVSFYREQATTTRDIPGVGHTEIITREGHDRFMRQFRDVLEPFVSPDELRRMDELGNLAEVVEQSTRMSAQIERQFMRDTLAGRLTKMNSEGVLEALFAQSPRRQGGSGFSIDDTVNLVRWLEVENPQLLANVRAATQDEIRRRITQDGYLDLSKLDDLLRRTGDNDSVGGKLRVVMGARYMNDLRLLRDALNITNRGGRAIPEEGASDTMVGLARRILIPPLTQRGRAATALQQKLRRFGHDALSEIISNPAQLREFVTSMERQITTERVDAVLSATGLNILLESPYDPTPHF